MKGNLLNMAIKLPYHTVVKHIDEILNKYDENNLTVSYLYPPEAIDEICDYLYEHGSNYQIDSISSTDGFYNTYTIAMLEPNGSIAIPFMFHVYCY